MGLQVKRKHTKPAPAKASANCGRFPECMSPPAPCARMMPTAPRLTLGLVTTQDSILPFSKRICKSACICYTDKGPRAELPRTTVSTHSKHSCRLIVRGDLWNAKAPCKLVKRESGMPCAQASIKFLEREHLKLERGPVEILYARFRFFGPS